MQAYVIATSTLVEISKVDVSKFDDAYFKSSDKAQKKKGEDAFFEEKTEKKELSADYIDNQKKVSPDLSWMYMHTSCCPHFGNLQLAYILSCTHQQNLCSLALVQCTCWSCSGAYAN